MLKYTLAQQAGWSSAVSKKSGAVRQAANEKREAELQRRLDEALGMTFPASDPVAISVEPRPRKEVTHRGAEAAIAKSRRPRG